MVLDGTLQLVAVSLIVCFTLNLIASLSKSHTVSLTLSLTLNLTMFAVCQSKRRSIRPLSRLNQPG